MYPIYNTLRTANTNLLKLELNDSETPVSRTMFLISLLVVNTGIRIACYFANTKAALITLLDAKDVLRLS